jgi:hypothetical protein
MKSRNQDMTQDSVVSDWLFPAHRFFPYTGRDITFESPVSHHWQKLGLDHSEVHAYLKVP